MKATAIYPEKAHALYDQHGYSPALRSGDLLFVSGQVGALPDGSPEPDVAHQTRLAFENLSAVLKAADATFEDVVDVTIFVVDPQANLEAIMPVMAEYYGEKPYPNATVVGVTWLSGFAFEIKAIARLPKSLATSDHVDVRS